MSNFVNTLKSLFSTSASTANVSSNGSLNKNTDMPLFNFGNSNNNNNSGSTGLENIPNLESYLKSAGITVTPNCEVDYSGLGWAPSTSSKSFTSMGWGPNFKKLNPITSSGNKSTNAAGTGMKSANAGTYGNTQLSQEQVNNAKIIADVGKSMGMSQRDIQIAIATAMQESSLQNINYGDRDSVGLFQQRPSCGWGTVAQCTDPQYAAKKFFETLKGVTNRNSMSLTQAAQAVQRSGFPDAYAKWENMASSLTA